MSHPNHHFVSRDKAQAPFFVGVDVGDTNVQVGVVDDLGQSFSWLSIPTESQKGPEDATRRMGDAVREAIRQAGLAPSAVVRVGLGSAGILDSRSGVLVKLANLQGWDGFPLRDRASSHCGLPVTLVNDVNAAAYGEFWVGSGHSFHSMVFFMLGTGVGCGIIIGDLSIDGENGHGVECGHAIIDCSENARLCGCGQRGHLEAYASGTAVVLRMREALESGRPSSLRQRLAQGCEPTPKLLAEEAEAGDALSREIVAETARYLGVGIVNLMHTVDPEGVLLGGAMTFGGCATPLGRQFLARVKEEIARRAFPVLVERTIIDFATLGGDAGYLGAASLARLEHRQLMR